jgi:spore coat protein B
MTRIMHYQVPITRFKREEFFFMKDEKNEKNEKRKYVTSDVDYTGFLDPLLGKEVKVNRGGPESKSGILLDFQSDYIALYPQDDNSNDDGNDDEKDQEKDNKQNSVVYYQLKHIKSVSEDSKSNSTQSLDKQEIDVEFLKSDCLIGIINEFKEKYIQINQGGPESKTGLALDVKEDYIILFTEDDGVVYFNIQHVKSICEYNQDNDDQDNTFDIDSIETIKAKNFHRIFSKMGHKWVSINRGGPEAMEGVLVETSGGHYTLISNEEVLRILPYHIRSISSGPKGSLQQNNQDEQEDNNCTNENDDDKEDNKQDESSDEKRSYRYRSTSDNRRSSRDRDGKRSYRSRKTSDKRRSYRDPYTHKRRSYGNRASYSKRRSYRDREAYDDNRSKRIVKEDIVKTIDYKWDPKW